LAKPKAKKQAKKGKSQKRRLPRFAWLAIALGIVAIVAFARTYPSSEPVNPNNSGQPTAAIIDQLSLLETDERFITNVTRDLEHYGFVVDTYHGNAVTVDLYKNLPSHGYKLIVLRAHSGLMRKHGSSTYPEITFLFTGEKYGQYKYSKEQLTDQIVPATMAGDYPAVFAVNSKFINHTMKGKFNNTIIIMTGCSGLKFDDLASAFIEKGASSYIGYDATVLLNYSDETAAYLVGQLCHNATIEEATMGAVLQKGRDPIYYARPEYFPPQSGNKTLKELM